MTAMARHPGAESIRLVFNFPDACVGIHIVP